MIVKYIAIRSLEEANSGERICTVYDDWNYNVDETSDDGKIKKA